MIAIEQVDAGLWRGPQPTPIDDFLKLKNLGIKYILNLETSARLVTDGDALQEALRIDTYGIRMYPHPLSAVIPPSKQQLLDAVQFITDHPMTYVHCRQGVDRTGMVCAAYRIKVQKWTVPAAVNEMNRLGFHWWYFYWTPVLETL